MFNFTTYNIRRDQDTIKAHGERSTIMVNAKENNEDSMHHPYWYARVLGIHHAMVYFKNTLKPQRMEFLRVRWFQNDEDFASGARHLRLNCVRYVDGENAFGFLDPGQVLRACHLVPAFDQLQTVDYLGPSVARDLSHGDWRYYYVMR